MRGFETARRLEGCPDGYKTENEDRAEITEAGDALVFVVADGVGGRPHGGAAAQRAVEIVQKAVRGERANDDAAIWAERLAGIDRLLLRARFAHFLPRPITGAIRRRHALLPSDGD